MFKNEALLDFSLDENRQLINKSLNELEQDIKAGKLLATPIVNGEVLHSPKINRREDPSDPNLILGQTELTTLDQCEKAIKSLSAYFTTWRGTKFEDRAGMLKRAANEMRTRKGYLTALMIREAGKPWREADADVAEAIDFCDYYAEEMLRLGQPQIVGDRPAELNTYFYQPRGVVAVISPWNFPLAIACGMTVAALVTGNTVAFKPSEQTSLIAAELVQILWRAGIPTSALAFLPGVGEEIGAHLVNSPLVSMICFTGSREVGLKIIEQAAPVRPGQSSVKRVVAEMGGKNATIVDSDADSDEAIKGVIQSAFGYAGQKCSACSRLIVVGDGYLDFMSRLVEAAKDIIVGKASDPATLLGPVIDQGSQKRIIDVIARGERGASLAFKGQVPNNGYFVPATIFKDVPTSSFIWQQEIFGPVLACLRVDKFEEGVRLANESDYALTGAVFSRSPKNLEYARREFRVGNLYLNRKSTGALVCCQPFGGFKMSGVGSKAGGPDYLIQFMEPRTVTENTMRRGFVPA